MRELTPEELSKAAGGWYEDVSVDQTVSCPKCGATAFLKFYAGVFDHSKDFFTFYCPSCNAHTESNTEYAQWLTDSINSK